MLTTAETLVSACLSLPTIRGAVTEPSDPKLTMSVVHHGSFCPPVHNLVASSIKRLQDKKTLPSSNVVSPTVCEFRDQITYQHDWTLA